MENILKHAKVQEFVYQPKLALLPIIEVWGGAIIDSGISLMQLCEITSIQHSKQRSLGNPYIMMNDRIITMRSNTFDTAYLCYDHLNMPLKRYF